MTNAQTNVGYKGMVTLQLRKGKKKPYRTMTVKNAGTNSFFRILCTAVTGSSMNAYMPQFLGVYTGTGVTERPAASVRVHWDTATVEQDVGASDAYYALFSFVLPGSYINSGVSSVTRLKLFNSLGDVEELASIDIGEEGMAVSPESNLYVDWKLYFGNWSEQDGIEEES